MIDLTAERLRELLHYDQDTGVFTWLVARGNARAGEVAGSLDNRGYRVIRIDRRIYKAHRLAWLYMTGAWPDAEIDHINMDHADNRWRKLRQATPSQNKYNTRVQSNNTSGFKGVSWHNRRRKWVAEAWANGKKIYIGQFDTPHQAYAKYCLAARKHFGEFARVYEADQLILPRKVFEEHVLKNLLKATQCQFEEAA